MAQAGKNIRLYRGEAPVHMASPEACAVVTGKVYKICDDTKCVLRSPEFPPSFNYLSTMQYTWRDLPYEKWCDYAPYFMVYDGGTTFSDRVDPTNIKWVDFLTGTIEFKSAYTPLGTIYIKTDYIPISNLFAFNTLEIKEEIKLNNITTFGTVDEDLLISQNASQRKQKGIYEVTGSLSGVYDYDTSFGSKLRMAEYLYIQCIPDIVNQPDKKIIIKCLLEDESKDLNVENPNKVTINWQAHGPVSEVI